MKIIKIDVCMILREEDRNALRGVTFLSLNKKVTKEVSLGESAQASLRQFAPSPKNPSLNRKMHKDRLH